MKFFILGLTHKNCPVEVREKLHFDAKKTDAFLSGIRNESAVAELVLISTCNRVEFCGFAESPREAEERILSMIEAGRGLTRSEFAPYLHRSEGKAAVHHLFRVASGLDSLVVGENEILGQVREAFRMANDAGTVHSLLYRLLEKALKTGKDVRTKTKINEGAVSIPSVAVELAEKIFSSLSGQKIMVLGTGEMSELTLKNLRSAGGEVSCIVSRNHDRGELLAREFGAEWVPMDGWENYLAGADIVISSTAAPHPVVRYDTVKKIMSARRHRPLFFIDIAVPRDVESEVNEIDDVYLYNIDDLKTVSASNLRLRRREVSAAENLVEAAVLDYQGWLERLKARPTMERFENFLSAVIEAELAHFAESAHADAETKKKLRARITAKLMHPPLEKIREASLNGGVQRYLEALHSLFDLEDRPQTADRRPQIKD